MKLKKAEGWRWEKLENDGCASTAKQFNPGKSLLSCLLSVSVKLAHIVRVCSSVKTHFYSAICDKRIRGA